MPIAAIPDGSQTIVSAGRPQPTLTKNLRGEEGEKAGIDGHECFAAVADKVTEKHADVRGCCAWTRTPSVRLSPCWHDLTIDHAVFLTGRSALSLEIGGVA